MKRPILLTLIGIVVALLVIGVVFVAPWTGKMFDEMETLTEQQHQRICALEASAREPLTTEQENLSAQLLKIAERTDIFENPNDLERILSSEPYLAYLKVLEGETYENYPAYIAAIPTPSMKTVAHARIQAMLGADIGDEELEIWTNYYFKVREWGKFVEDPHDIISRLNEINELYQTYLETPLQESNIEISDSLVQIGLSSIFMTDYNSFFRYIWSERLKTDGLQKGLLWCAIASPSEFALMRSFFTDMTAFQEMIFRLPKPEKTSVDSTE